MGKKRKHTYNFQHLLPRAHNSREQQTALMFQSTKGTARTFGTILLQNHLFVYVNLAGATLLCPVFKPAKFFLSNRNWNNFAKK